MVNMYELRKKIDAFIESLAANRVERFYPSALAKHLDIPVNQAFNYLLERSGSGDQLLLKWELRCPECNRTLDISVEKVTDFDVECRCGKEFELQSSDFFPVFQINPEYKDYIKGEMKKKAI